ncbi:glycosyltransferase family 39 protein [Chloracidobacterium sp. MS 40/45]|uniref:ArnT family glycosyltransferase n=1 Tax=Chloracidobacterium aggregatum TaxID=2851959 RepID=UPI001B8CF1DC|nr:glycosyltransferase family 39 protein [Chloracidobacterium aggregatum]QUV99392.1 glycosyltransferase family 39 protein [Chloracidobacterium sp. MS 40/45]
MTPTAPNALRLPPAGRQHLWFGLIGLLGAGWLWFAMSRHGIGLSPDSVGYLAVAQHLLEGRGFLSYRGEPFVAQPPLYPLVIATISFLLGFTPETSALLLNLLLFVAVAYLSGRLALLVTKSFPLSIAVCISVILGVPITWVSVFAWSEMLFIFLTTLAFLNLIGFISSRDTRDLLACSLYLACSCMVRYAGLFSVFSFLLVLILVTSERLQKKAYQIVAFSFISSLPISLWVLRNYILSGTPFGPRTMASLKPKEIIFLLFDTFSSWFILQTDILQNYFILIAIFIFLTFAVSTACICQIKDTNILSLVIFVSTYSLFVFVSSMRFAYDPIDNRLLSPVFISLVVVLLSFSNKVLYPYLKSKVSGGAQSRLIILGALIWFTHPVLSTLTLGFEVRREGKGYHAVHWQTSPTLAHVRQVREQLTQRTVYTNDPEGLYFLAHIRAEHLPFRFRPTWPEAGQAYLIRFKRAYRGECLDIIEGLRQAADIEPLARFSDGEIYLVTHKPLQVPSQ